MGTVGTCPTQLGAIFYPFLMTLIALKILVPFKLKIVLEGLCLCVQLKTISMHSYAHLHIMRDLKKLKAVKKRVSIELFKILCKKKLRNCKGELHFQLFLELSCCKRRQKSPSQEMVNKGHPKVLNDTKLIPKDYGGQSSFRTFRQFPKPVSWLRLFLPLLTARRL